MAGYLGMPPIVAEMDAWQGALLVVMLLPLPSAAQICAAGSYLPSGTTTCLVCPGNTRSAAGASVCTAKIGFYNVDANLLAYYNFLESDFYADNSGNGRRLTAFNAAYPPARNTTTAPFPGTGTAFFDNGGPNLDGVIADDQLSGFQITLPTALDWGYLSIYRAGITLCHWTRGADGATAGTLNTIPGQFLFNFQNPSIAELQLVISPGVYPYAKWSYQKYWDVVYGMPLMQAWLTRSWSHTCHVFKNTGISIYKDCASSSCTPTYPASTNSIDTVFETMIIGVAPRMTSFFGWLAEVRFYAKALTAEEIFAVRSYTGVSQTSVISMPCPQVSGCVGTTRCLNDGTGVCCGSGTFFVEGASTACQACPPGSFGYGNDTACQACPAGSFGYGNGTACAPCTAGTYSAVTGAGSCALCGAGSYSTGLGLSSPTSCIQCPYGQRSPAGASQCTLLPGVYNLDKRLMAYYNFLANDFYADNSGRGMRLSPVNAAIPPIRDTSTAPFAGASTAYLNNQGINYAGVNDVTKCASFKASVGTGINMYKLVGNYMSSKDGFSMCLWIRSADGAIQGTMNSVIFQNIMTMQSKAWPTQDNTYRFSIMTSSTIGSMYYSRYLYQNGDIWPYLNSLNAHSRDWTHLCWTFSASRISLYVNCSSMSCAPRGSASENSEWKDINYQELLFGCAPLNSAFIGWLAEIRFYNKTLTPAEVFAVRSYTGVSATPGLWAPCSVPNCNGGLHCFANDTGICCQSGTFFVEGVSTECQLCPLGTYSDGSGSDCTPCPPGSYSAVLMVSSCVKCDIGTYSSGIGLTSPTACTTCPAGTTSLTGSASATACAAPCGFGFYGAGTCSPCPAGTYLSSTGSFTPDACNPCAPGVFSTSLGATSAAECMLCAAGTFLTASGAPSSALCGLCGAGTFSTASGMTSSSFCALCGAGTYSSASGLDSSTSCALCVAGTYSTALGLNSSTSCAPCPNNTRSKPGAVQCAISPGFFLLDRHLQAYYNFLAPDFYADNSGNGMNLSAYNPTKPPSRDTTTAPFPGASTAFFNNGGLIGKDTATAFKVSLGAGFSVLSLLGTPSSPGPGMTICFWLRFADGAMPGTVNSITEQNIWHFQKDVYPSQRIDDTIRIVQKWDGLTWDVRYSVQWYSNYPWVQGISRYWTHYCWTMAHNSYKVYTNCSSSSCPVAEAVFSSVTSLYPNVVYQQINIADVGFTNAFFGWLAEVRLYRRALTPAEVLAVRSYTGVSATSSILTPCPSTGCNGTIRCLSNGTGICCRSGTFFIEGTSTACQPCPAGTFGDGGDTACAPCAAGTYSTAIGIATCTACGPGTYSSASGLQTPISCTACPPGKSSPKGSTNVTACDNTCGFGYYGSGSCTPCPAGTYGTAMGALTSDTCTRCAAGGFSTASGLNSSVYCVLCGNGMYSTALGASSSASCALCGIGAYSNATGATSSAACAKCDPGTYSTSAGGAVCALCEAGTFSTGQGLTLCYSCLAGSTSVPGSVRCSIVQQHYYDLKDSLLRYFPFNDGSVTTDVATGTVQLTPGSSVPSLVPSGPFTDRTGLVKSNALSMDSLSTTKIYRINPVTIPARFTMCTWVFFKDWGLRASHTFAQLYNPTDVKSFQCNGDSGLAWTCIISPYGALTYTKTITPERWYHFCVGVGIPSIKMWVDGVLGFNDMFGPDRTAMTYSDNALGAFYGDSLYGMLAEFRIYGNLLNNNEVLSLYNFLPFPPYTYFPSVYSQCTPCQPFDSGHCTINGSSVCCASGTSFRDGFDSACQVCTPGTYGDGAGSSCLSCPSGQTSGYAALYCALNCSTGTYMANASDLGCKNCRAGTYQNITAATACLLCGPGTFSSGVGMGSVAACQVCSAGKYSSALGASSAWACQNCPPGTFSLASGVSSSSACSECLPNRYCLDGLMLACPSNTSSLAGAKAQADCTCNAGFQCILRRDLVARLVFNTTLATFQQNEASVRARIAAAAGVPVSVVALNASVQVGARRLLEVHAFVPMHLQEHDLAPV